MIEFECKQNEQISKKEDKNVKSYFETVKGHLMSEMGDECSWEDPLESEHPTGVVEKVITVKSSPEQPTFGLHVKDMKLKMQESFKNLEVFINF